MLEDKFWDLPKIGAELTNRHFYYINEFVTDACKLLDAFEFSGKTKVPAKHSMPYNFVENGFLKKQVI